MKAKFGEGSVAKWLNGAIVNLKLATVPSSPPGKGKGKQVTDWKVIYTIVDESKR